MLDWCCIGAQKAGTSTLFDLLRDHPELYIPPGKEEPLFDGSVDSDAVAAYYATHFPDELVRGRRAGTVTPQYMSSPATAARMHALVPTARIVVMLRDPARRAYSQYRMNIRRGIESRPFAQAVDDQLAALESGEPADPGDETATYVWRGFYSRILEPWFELYTDRSIHVVLTDDLDQDPVNTVHDVLRFLDVEVRTTGREGVRAHADPPRHRFPHLRRRVSAPLRRVGLLELVPGRQRERMAYRVESVLARVAPPKPQHDDGSHSTIEYLRSIYEDDRASLEKLIGRTPPW